MEAQIFNDIWNNINNLLDWGIIIIVWGSGYGILLFRRLKKISKTIRVLIASFVLTAVYVFANNSDVGVSIVSYVFAFGFHTIALKWVDRKILRNVG